MLNRFQLARLRAFRKAAWVEQAFGGKSDGAGARVLCVASGKGGVGKSVLATNLAVLRAEQGERVLLVDFDAGLANAHLLLGVVPRHDLGHVLRGQTSVEEALVGGPAGVSLLSGGVGREVLVNPTRRDLDKIFQVLRPLERDYDLVIIDHGAGMGYATIAHLAATSTLLLVSNHEITALSDAYALYKRAHAVNASIRVGMVFNRVPGQEAVDAAWNRFRSTSQKFLGHAPELVGWVPADEAVARSVQERTPVVRCAPDSASSRAIREVSSWGPIDHARTTRAFYDQSRKALR